MKRGLMVHRSTIVTFALLVAALPPAACAVQTDRAPESSPRSAPQDVDAVVTIADISFSPSAVEINAGETVAWVWDDGSVPHDVVFSNGPASPQQSDGTWEHRFEGSGSFDYHCTIHPQMTGTVVVT
jgi:plastocyanin